MGCYNDANDRDLPDRLKLRDGADPTPEECFKMA
jgi:hypothetical protein